MHVAFAARKDRLPARFAPIVCITLLTLLDNMHNDSRNSTQTTGARIAEIMASLLRLKAVTAADDFFSLGGNSLLSAQLAFQVQQEYRVDLDVRDIFEAKTLQRITELVHTRMNGGNTPEAAPRTAVTPAESPSALPILPDTLPATAQQRSIWLLEQSPAGKGVSNVAIVLSYRGSIDDARLERSLRKLVYRHPALRSTFAKDGAAVVQHLKKFATFDRRFIDLSALSGDEKSTALEEIKTEEISRPFDLERDTMVRLTHMQLEADQGVLLFVFHHIAVDDRSLEIFFEQLQAVYEADDQQAVAQHGRSFLDYCQEEAEAETNGDYAAAIPFWRTQLAGMRSSAYPSRGSIPVERLFAGRHYYHVLPAKLGEAIDAAAARCSTTPFGIFAAGVIYLLYRATGHDDICIASLMSRRDRFTEHDVIGCFVNTVPLRTRVREDWSLAQLIEAVITTFVDAYAHRHVAFEDMMEAVEANDAGRGRAFPVTVNLEAEKVEEFSLGDAFLRREPLDRGIAKRDLVLSLRKVAGTYRILVEHRSDLYTAEEVRLLSENLESALEHLAFDPGARVGARLLAPPRAMPAVISSLGWHHTGNYEPVPVHTLFRMAGRDREQKTAVIGAGGAITYGELDKRSDAVTSALVARGVKAGDLVGVVQSRQVETIGTLLGIWKAGAGYAVIDTAQPASALERMCEVCRPALLVGCRGVLDTLSLAIPTLAVEEAWLWPISPSVVEQAKAVPAETTAYVCFTSGSSGIPKGVAVSHASITRIVRHASYAAISSEDTFLNVSPLGFDGSVFEIWAPLTNGATLRLMNDGAFALDEIAAALDHGQVSILFLTTQLFNALVDTKLDSLLKVRTILFGGEKASREHVERFVAAGYAGNLRNMYGPTESTVFATSHAISRESLDQYRGAIPIGRAHNDTSVAVINEHLALVPCGVIGEIAIGGPGVAKGYVKERQLTAKSFIQLALPGGRAERFYRSGDTGYFDAAGEIHFVGRRDRQVKVSGYRIELDEIESVIGRAPGVNGCHCLAANEVEAFVACDKGRTSPEEIKAYVRSQLPAYKIPSRFVFTGWLPLNNNGKVDVDALERLRHQAGDAVTAAPVSALDLAQTIREVWRNELQSDAFGDDDNFFDVGGTSLKIMLVHDELSNRLRERGLTREIEITHLFEFTTVASLSEFLEGLIDVQ
jgi:amino acid adenylation domain-containing protein